LIILSEQTLTVFPGDLIVSSISMNTISAATLSLMICQFGGKETGRHRSRRREWRKIVLGTQKKKKKKKKKEEEKSDKIFD